MKKLFFTLIFITALTFAQQAQAQETKEYAVLVIFTTEYVIAYPDGKTESGKIQPIVGLKTMEPHTSEFTKLVNDLYLSKKGYRFVGGDSGKYIFEK